MSGFLVDTDWFIDALTGQTVALRALRHLPPAVVAVSVITVGELFEAAFNSSNPQAHIA